MKQTTIPHLVIERLKEPFEYPAEVKNNLYLEYEYALPVLMCDHRDLFFEVCDEVDVLIEQGIAQFGDDGIITIK